MDRAVEPESFGQVITRVYFQWASEQVDVVPGSYVDHEHSLLMDASPEADADLFRRTIDALRVAGYGRYGRLKRISHQRAKQFVNEYLAAESGPRRVAGSAVRIGPVWCVSEIDPDVPNDMLIGRAFAVFDDGEAYQIGSLPPETEITDLLDRLDPTRCPHSLRPWAS